jgi:hypothetical protein
MPDPRWDESQVERVLMWAEKPLDSPLVGDEPLRDLLLAELREMFGVAADDPSDPPMFDGYKVEPRHVKRLQAAVTHQIDMDRFSYFVAAYQKAVPTHRAG